MAIETGGLGEFDYRKFTDHIAEVGFTEMRSTPLNTRLDLLQAKVDVLPRPRYVKTGRSSKGKIVAESKEQIPRSTSDQKDFLCGEPGSLMIVDLTDPVVDNDSACTLFDLCLSIFVSQTACAKVIALDEAHNYMQETNAAAAQFTERLLKTIREQRHQGARVAIATQEPGIDPRLLDLCNVPMVQRFTSPA